MSKIQASAKIKIPNGKLEEYKQHLTEYIRQIKEKDTGTLQFDCFINDDKTECEIREAYESSEADASASGSSSRITENTI